MDIRIVKPTGALVRGSPTAEGVNNIVGVAHYGDLLRGATLSKGWWALAGSRFVLAAEAVSAGPGANPLGARGRAAPRYQPLSQRDPRWKDQLLGNTTVPTVTIGDYGCLLTCFTMLINSALVNPLTPDQVNNLRKGNGGYLPVGAYGGYAARFNVDDETAGAVKIGWFSERYEQVAPDDVVARLVRHLQDGQPAILEVDFFPSDSTDPAFPPQPGRQMHFVLAIPDGASPSSITVIDPWDGQTRSITPRFGKMLPLAVVRAVLYENWADIQPQPLPPGQPAPQPAPAPRLPAPILARDIGLGVHVLNVGRSAQQAYDLGCRWFTIMDSPDVAAELVRKGATVLYRRSLPNYLVTPDQYMAAIGPLIPGAWYLGVNEGDSIGDGVNDIRKRAAFDVAVARLIQARSGGRAKYIGGGFATGTPDITNPAICAALRDGYSAAYNEGLLLFNLHTYVGAKEGARSLFAEDGVTWWARRWEFLFTRCGFDPRVRGIVSAESGLDNDGGFIHHNYTPSEFSAFARRWREVQARPVMIDNRDTLVAAGRVPRSDFVGRWNSPYLGGTFYQLTPQGTQAWARFNLTPYLNVLRDEIWPLKPDPAGTVWA